jgi:hypothetical protein
MIFGHRNSFYIVKITNKYGNIFGNPLFVYMAQESLDTQEALGSDA